MIYAIAAVLVLIADQWLKYWVTVNIELNSGSITLIPGVLDLVNIHNTGAAFGLLDGGGWRWVFVVIALAFVVIAVYAIRRGLIRGAVGRWAVVGVLAGAIGNCIDRVINGYVVDMFQPVFLEGTMFGAIFNVADMFISCCGILFCLYILFGHEYRTAKPVGDEEEYEPAQRRPAPRQAQSSSRARGGSHAKGGAPARRVPAREARSERVSAEPVRTEPAPERTRIPVQQPRPQQSRPVQARQPRAVDPSDPFAEWEKKPQAPAAQPRPAQSAAPRAAETAPSAKSQPAAPRASEPAKPKKGEYEFTLEEILAEFSDK